MKKILIVIGVFLAVVLITWGICETVGSDYYNYKGYVTNVFENENGETVIVTLLGTKESEFTFKWYTRIQKAPMKLPVAVGDYVMLSTTRTSDTNIKKIKVNVGYSTEGRLVYVEELNSPFVLAVAPETKNRYLVSVVVANDGIIEGLNMGDTVKFYHPNPVDATLPTLVAESVAMIEQSSPGSFTEEDIAFIEAQGYSIRVE